MRDLSLRGAAIYQTWQHSCLLHLNVQACNFASVSYLKGFGASKLEFETFELY